MPRKLVLVLLKLYVYHEISHELNLIRLRSFNLSENITKMCILLIISIFIDRISGTGSIDI
jgi:hypothetical protein